MRPAQTSEGPTYTPETTVTGVGSLPTRIWIGILLALFGVALTGIAWAWEIFGFQAVMRAGGIALYEEVVATFETARALVVGVGFFLIFAGLLRPLPGSRPWLWVGALLTLLGSIGIAVGYATEIALYSSGSVFSGGYSPLLSYTIFALVAGGSVLVSLGIVLALIGIARGAFSRSAIPAPPPVP